MAEAELRERATEEGDARGRWPIARYLDIRQVPGRARRFEALVQWHGEQWIGQDSWEPLANLTVDVRREAQAEADVRFPRPRPTLSTLARRRAVTRGLSRRVLVRGDGVPTADVREVESEGSSEEEPYNPVRATRVLCDSPPARRRRRRIQIGSSSDSAEDSA